MASVPILCSEVDFSKFVYDSKKTLKKGPENCKLFYGKGDFNLQIPKIKVPFGKSEPLPEFKKSGDDEKHAIELSLDTKNEKIAEFKEFLKKFDEFNTKYVSDNSKELFGDYSTPDEIRKHKLYNSVIKVQKDKSSTYPDRFKVKMPLRKGRPDFKVLKKVDGKFDEISFWKQDETVVDKYEIDWNWATKGMEIVPIVQCEGLWIVNGKAYCGWKLVIVRVYDDVTKNFGATSFRDEDDEVVEDTKAAAVVDEVEEGSSEEVVEEEEVEEEEEDGDNPDA